MNNTQNNQYLINELKNFGLNPNQWKLKVPISEDFKVVVLENLEDQDFQLLAHLNSDEQKLENIEILSI